MPSIFVIILIRRFSSLSTAKQARMTLRFCVRAAILPRPNSCLEILRKTEAMRERAEDVAGELAKVVRGDVFTDILHRAAYASDASIYQIIPGCVVVPCDAADVAAVVKYAGAPGIAGG